jgi:hypothetical protein
MAGIKPGRGISENHPRGTSNWLLRLGLVVVLAAVGTGLSLLIVPRMLDVWQFWEHVAFLRESERHSLGPANPPSPETFFPMEALSRPPIVTDFQILSARETEQRVSDAELVLGVAIDGEARAYPLNMMNGPLREVFNDTVGGKPIAATWCHLCHTAIVFARVAQGQTLTLGVSGLLWEGNLVMFDQETETLWSQMMGEAMRGPLVGERLEILPATLTDWRSWVTRYPETTCMFMDRTADAYEKGFNYRSYNVWTSRETVSAIVSK